MLRHLTDLTVDDLDQRLFEPEAQVIINEIVCHELLRLSPTSGRRQVLCSAGFRYGRDCDVGHYHHGDEQPYHTLNLPYMTGDQRPHEGQRAGIDPATALGYEYQRAGKFGYEPGEAWLADTFGIAWHKHDDDPCEPSASGSCLAWVDLDDLEDRQLAALLERVHHAENNLEATV